MSSFRERFGCDWLQYRNHLEASAPSTVSPDALSPGPVPSPPPPEKESPQEVAEEVRPELEPQEEEELEEQGEEEGGEEQSEVEGERSVAAREANQVVVMCPGVRRAHVRGWTAAPQWGPSLGHLFLLTASPSPSLLSGALPAHVGVSPGGARGRAGQRVLSLGHYGPPI